MADLPILPRDLPEAVEPLQPSDVFIVDQGAGRQVAKVTATPIVNSVSPVATESESQVGTNNYSRMTPLRTKQAIASEVGVSIASYAAGQAGLSAVQTVNGKSGNSVTLNKADIGLANVDNTSDANKPVSTAQLAALNLKANNSVVISGAGGLIGGGPLTDNRSISLSPASIASLALADTSVQTVNGVSPSGGNVNVTAQEVRLQNTIASAQTTSFGANVLFVQTSGYYIVGDGGGALYKKVSSEPAHIGKFQSSDGAWWEIAEDFIDPRQLGATGGGVANDTTYVQAAVSLGKMKSNILFGISSTIVVPSGTSPIFRVKWIGLVDRTAIRIPVGTGTVIRGCEVDGNSLANVGIEDLGQFSVIDNCHVHHVHSLNGQARGIVGYNATGGGVYSNNNIHDIYAPGNGIVGDEIGPSRAIALFYPAAITTGYTISNNVIHDLNGEEADAIHVLFISGTTYLSSAKTRIAGNRIWNSAKRCIKVQAADTIIDGNIVRLAGTEGVSVAAIDVQQSDRCSITNNDVAVTGVGVWGVTYVNSPTIVPEVVTSAGVISGNRVFTSGTDNNGAIYARRINQVKITDNYVTNGRVYVETCSAPYVSGNFGLSTRLSGQDGFISIRANSFNASVINNEVGSGDVYCCVRTDASKSMIKGNVCRAVTTANTTCVYVNTFNCVIMDNINFLIGSEAVRYQSGTAANQQLVVNNHQFTV